MAQVVPGKRLLTMKLIQQGLFPFLSHSPSPRPHSASLLVVTLWSLTFHPLVQLPLASTDIVSVGVPASQPRASMFFKRYS